MEGNKIKFQFPNGVLIYIFRDFSFKAFQNNAGATHLKCNKRRPTELFQIFLLLLFKKVFLMIYIGVSEYNP